MKKIIIMVVLILVVCLLPSCIPIEPKEMQPYCREQYEVLLVEYPDYPHAFIGACVAYLQSGKPTAFVSLCGYEPFRESIEIEEIDTKHECIQYIKGLED